MFEYVDPFIGTEATSYRPRRASQRPGGGRSRRSETPTLVQPFPFGMVSACSYSGAYPTGYGLYELNTEGVPPRMYEEQIASGFTHFHQSGTGAIRKYYNYFRVTPMLDPLDCLGNSWELTDEVAEPGYYAATLVLGNPLRADRRSAQSRCTGTRSRLTATPGSSSTSRSAGCSSPTARTVPTARASGDPSHPESPRARSSSRVPRWRFTSSATPCDWRQLLWYDRRLMPGGTRLDFDRHPADHTATVRSDVERADRGRAGRRAALRLLTAGRRAGRTEPAGRLRHRQRPVRRPARDTATEWRKHLGTISIDTPSAERRTVFATALYHSLDQALLRRRTRARSGRRTDRSCSTSRTMWDIYKTQLPLITALLPDRAVELAQRAAHVSRGGGQLPDRLPDGQAAPTGSCRQAQRAGPHVPGRPLPARAAGRGLGLGAVHMHNDLRRTYGEEYLLRGIAHPVTHTLDICLRLPLHGAGGPRSSATPSWPSSSSSWPLGG